MTKNRKDLTPRRVSRLTAARAKPQTTANIKVVIRVRPPNEHEQGECHRYIVKCRESNVLTFDPEEDSTPFFFHGVKQQRRDLLKKQNKNLQFVFDNVFSDAAKFQPSPSKRLAQNVRSSPRVKIQKENRTAPLTTNRRLVGTMGTSSRFPSKQFNQQASKRPFR